ncbi:MAG TPA: amidohydrolase family protein [Terriglobales bacterium]|nr:amidohydrolase family protein [Terriglobales bacterium]
MLKKLGFALLLSSLAFAQTKSSAAGSSTIVLKGGKLLTVTHGTIENGVLVMENGKITAVGAVDKVNVPANAQVIDVTGMTVYPGLIDSETNLGLTEISAEKMTTDLVETSDEIMPHMHTREAFHAETELIPVTRANGVLNAIVAPESKDTLPGQDSFIQLAGASATDMLLVKDIAMPLNFIGDVRRNETFEKAKYPQTRMGMAAQLRQAFLDAQDYQQRMGEYTKKKADWDKSDRSKPEPVSVKHDLKLEALMPYLEGRRPVVLAANEASDVETAVALAQEFRLKIVLNHLTHSQPVLDYVASLKVPVIVGPIYEEPKQDERYDTVYALPAQLQKRGVKVIFASYDSHQSRNLPYAAGYAVAYGLPYEEALKGLTLYPAEVWGLADQLGSLDVGKTANLVVANGDPLDVKTDVKRIFVQGKEVSTDSRQSRLRDEYSK